MIRDDQRSLAEGLLQYAQLGDHEASVLVDTTSTPSTLRVFLYDPRRPVPVRIRKWRGHPVEFIKSGFPEAQKRRHRMQ